MVQLNENYPNRPNVSVLGASAHETSEIMVYEHPLFGKVRMFIKKWKGLVLRNGYCNLFAVFKYA